VNATTIAADVRARRRSAAEVVAASLDRIDALDGTFNAFTGIVRERAAAAAQRLDARIAAGEDPGPLAGVPFAAKNLFDVAGVVTLAGSKVLRGEPPAERDADAVAALEAAGAVLVGTTNMDEFAYGFVTENAHDGATRNPHDPRRIAGGSSGGSGAAVGAGMVALSLGSDTNGSIRVPAALCGIFGIRPTFGRLSRRGAYPFCASIDTVGPFAASAEDLILAFAAQARIDPAAVRAPRALRIARLDGYFDRGLVPAARAAVDRVCAALGATATIGFPEAQRAREAGFIVTAAEAGELHAARLRTQAADYDPATRERLTGGALMPVAWYLRAQRFRTWLVEAVRELFDHVDVLIAPATPYPATLVGQRTIVLDGIEQEIRPNVGAFTQPVSFTGTPVVAVPVCEPGALPLGVQLIARAGADELLLAVAQDLERSGAVGAGAPPVPA
jgi:AtzE family amidohydrolase